MPDDREDWKRMRGPVWSKAWTNNAGAADGATENEISC